MSVFFGLCLYFLDGKIPSVIYMRANEEQTFNIGVPAKAEIIQTGNQGKSNIPEGAVTIDLSNEVTMQTTGHESYSMQVKLFGFLPFKQMDVRVVEENELIPVGIPVGIYMKTEGLLVIGVGEFRDGSGNTCSPSKYVLFSGDYICKVNDEPVVSKKSFTDMVKNSNGEEMIFEVIRNGQTIKQRVKPAMDENGVYKLGIWVRDNTQGIGTITYMDTDGNFGALGHGITDIDTNTVMDIEDGTIYDTKIVSIKKGEPGEPGEMTGMIIYSGEHILGDITMNSPAGIFGCCNERAFNELDLGDAVPIAFKQEIVKGNAQIISTVDGNTCSYDIEITDIHLDHDNVNRGIEIKVTDNELIEKTGGIIQGMSGSPILQNGKIVGAVTHVLVQDPTRGYGIFIEEMLGE